MSFGDIIYVIAMVLFAYITFGIVRGYFKAKFDEDGHRKDMMNEKEKDSEEKHD